VLSYVFIRFAIVVAALFAVMMHLIRSTKSEKERKMKIKPFIFHSSLSMYLQEQADLGLPMREAFSQISTPSSYGTIGHQLSALNKQLGGKEQSVMYIEPLKRMMCDALEGVQIGDDAIETIGYADDLNFVIKNTFESDKIFKIFSNYCKESGAKVHFFKSGFLRVNNCAMCNWSTAYC
jgi:hypothetical protein